MKYRDAGIAWEGKQLRVVDRSDDDYEWRATYERLRFTGGNCWAHVRKAKGQKAKMACLTEAVLIFSHYPDVCHREAFEEFGKIDEFREAMNDDELRGSF